MPAIYGRAVPSIWSKDSSFFTDSAACSEGVDASLPHKPVSELQPHSQEPVEGAIEQHSNQSSPPKDAGSSLARLTQQPNQHDSTPNVAGFSPGCLTQVPDNCNQVRYYLYVRKRIVKLYV